MARRGTSKESSRRKSRKQTTAGKPSASRGTQSETVESKPRRATEVKAQAGITRNGGDGATKKRGLVSRALSAVAGAFSRRKRNDTSVTATNPTPTRKNEGGTAKAARGARRQPDIPMDQIESAYTPTQTSLKGPFRASGADRQRDQEFASGVADDRWNDEDRFTNKSGDPRIGTHGRTYEPGERRAAAGRSDEE